MKTIVEAYHTNATTVCNAAHRFVEEGLESAPNRKKAEFVAVMEDVLEVYQRPYDPAYPVVCLDESNRQLIEETRTALPVKPEEPRRVDYEYRRNGVVDFFMMFEPLAGQRHVEVRTSRTRKDFVYCIKQSADVYYPDCVKIVLVMDNLNTHSIASLYETFPPEEALRIANKLEIHYTPKHGSWLDMAEIEIGVMSRQCLNRYLSNTDFVTFQVSAWCSREHPKFCVTKISSVNRAKI